MSIVLDALRGFAAWWLEGLAKVGHHMSDVYAGLPAPVEAQRDGEADREAWEEERTRLALSPWWM